MGAEGVCGGIANIGYWGVHVGPVPAPRDLVFSMYARTPSSFVSPSLSVYVDLMDEAFSTSFTGSPLELTIDSTVAWKKYTGTLHVSSNSTRNSSRNARLVISFQGPATLIIDFVSLLPLENIQEGERRGHINPWPFRQDLLEALKALKPAFLRFPGGCFVEGDIVANAFRWKHSVGLAEHRPGHYNLWGYWSDDGLGLFEYMHLVEELGPETEAVWVINNGVAHGDSIPTARLYDDSWVQDAVESVEFVLGDAKDTRWGAVRAAMGRSDPFSKFNYIAIGNEDCGKPYYVQNYNVFYAALKSKYPDVKLISNCELGDDAAPAHLFDWHVYTNPPNMFALRRAFDTRPTQTKQQQQQQPMVFASEYAVTEGGGWGNLVAAIAEAGFMTGLERNSGRGVVGMAAYAPLFVNVNDRPWPTNLIQFDNARWFGIPSYHVQRMFREVQGVKYVETQIVPPIGNGVEDEETLAASTTCQNEGWDGVAVKIVNFDASNSAVVHLKIVSSGVHGLCSSSGDRTHAAVMKNVKMLVLTSEHPEDENTFDDPLKVSPREVRLGNEGSSSMREVHLPPMSFGLITFDLVCEAVGDDDDMEVEA